MERNKNIILNTIILTVLILLIPLISNSQISPSLHINATVLSQINVFSTRDLNFGTDILPGVNKSIDKSNSCSGKISLTGTPSRQIKIDFILPTNLTKNKDIIPITFDKTDGGYKTSAGYLQEFDPASGTDACFGTDGKLDILIGGKLYPDQTQISGTYTAAISVSLYYTGN